ncbi:MAG TPA: hypothetical protein VHO03_10310 [Ignavibacteriales bacterium]|nr:hypothetical protein [Ignavibacteriales bacterium]
MRYTFLSLLAALTLAFTSINAQTASSRVQKQHNVTRFMKTHLSSSIEMIARALENRQYNMRLSALQTTRQLEQLFPEESFSRLIQPLIAIINDSNLETETRALAAITLDQLHSDKGDAAIFTAAENCEDLIIKNLCRAITRVSDGTFVNASEVK